MLDVAPTARGMLAQGNALGIMHNFLLFALKGRRESPAPFQGAPWLTTSDTQGVALGWYPAALSAPL